MTSFCQDRLGTNIGKALTKKTRFLPGGYQEARGSGVSHNHYYIENVLEELDRCALF
jgi:hypothetical protein